MWVVRGVPLFGPHFFNSSSLASHVNEISLFEGKKLPKKEEMLLFLFF